MVLTCTRSAMTSKINRRLNTSTVPTAPTTKRTSVLLHVSSPLGTVVANAREAPLGSDAPILHNHIGSASLRGGGIGGGGPGPGTGGGGDTGLGR